MNSVLQKVHVWVRETKNLEGEDHSFNEISQHEQALEFPTSKSLSAPTDSESAI